MLKSLNKQDFAIMDKRLRERQKDHDDFHFLLGHQINGMSLTKKGKKQNLKGVDLGFYLENMEPWDIQQAEAENAHLSRVWRERGTRNKGLEVTGTQWWFEVVCYPWRVGGEQDEKEDKDETPQNINF